MGRVKEYYFNELENLIEDDSFDEWIQSHASSDLDVIWANYEAVARDLTTGGCVKTKIKKGTFFLPVFDGQTLEEAIAPYGRIADLPQDSKTAEKFAYEDHDDPEIGYKIFVITVEEE